MRTDSEWLGTARGPRRTFTARSYETWEITYEVGKYGIDDGGSVRIARRTVSDSTSPQVTDPRAPGYTSVWTNRDVRLHAAPTRHIRPFGSAFQIDVRDGSLYKGDRITVTFGNTGKGSPGIQMQTFREKEHLIKVFVDPFGTGLFKEVANSPSFTLQGGPANELQVAAPSQVVAGRPFDVVVRALDIHGNRSDVYRSTVSFTSDDPGAILPRDYSFRKGDSGARRFSGVILNGTGQHRITISDAEGRRGFSNPIVVLESEPELRLFWGDMHGQTKQTVGTGDLDEYLSFARDVAALDVTSWQGNDFQVTAKLWEEVKKKTRQYNNPGSFLTFLGYEWSGLTPAGGDHNIYFLGDDEKIHRSDHWLIEDKTDTDSDRYPISDLWKTFKGRNDVLAIPHVGGRYANLDYHDPERSPLIEVHSHHGTFEWFLEEAMKRRLKVGFVAASDDHTCRPGLTYPVRGFCTKGGYTGIYAKKLTREAVWEALWARRTYATSGERMIIHVESNDHLMGEEYTTGSPPQIEVKITGTSPLHEVEVKNWDRTIHRHPFAQPTSSSDKLLKIEWSGARVKSRSKTVNWDGGLTINGGRILSYEPFAFDYPDQGIQQITDDELRWRSTTGGDPDGVVLRLDAKEDSEITFDTDPVTFKFNPNDIEYEPRVIQAGGLNQKVRISTIRDNLPTNLDFTYRDKHPEEGLNAYWIRLVQSNGGTAWTSPIFVDYQ